MGESRLAGISLKLGRAQHHLKVLERHVEEMFSEDSCETFADLNTKGQPILRVRNIPPVDPRFGIFIGEVAHNFRSALDHLAYQLCIPAGASEPADPEAPAFPITSSSARWRNSRWRLKGAPRGAVAAIERLQPYHRRKNPPTWLLWQLRDLSDIDKHRLIHTAPAAIEAHQIKWSSSGPGNVVFRGYRVSRKPLKENAIALWWNFDAAPEAEMEVEAQLALGIAFDKATPSKALRYERALPLLWAIGSFITSEVVPALAPFLGEEWPPHREGSKA